MRNYHHHNHHTEKNTYGCHKLYTLSTISHDIITIPITHNVHLENMNLTEITGEAGSGKTQFCIHVILCTILPKSISCLQQGCLYISTVQKLSETRFNQFFSTYASLLSDKEQQLALMRLFHKHFNPNEFEKFFSIEIEKFIVDNSIKTIIIDSITGIADTQFIEDNNEVNYKERSKFLKIYLRLFKELIVKYNLFFFVTNNVSANLNEGNDASKPCLGKLWENGVNTRILLIKEKKEILSDFNNTKESVSRTMRISFGSYLHCKDIKFELNQSGIQFMN